jgi:hypothetical protein
MRIPTEEWPGPCGTIGDGCFVLQHAIDEAAMGLAIVGLGDDIPLAQGMGLGLVDQRRLISRSMGERLKIAPVPIHPEFKGEAWILVGGGIARVRRRVQAGLGIGLRQVKPALRRIAAIRPHQSFKSELRKAGQRVLVDGKPVMDTVEQHRLAGRCGDDLGLAIHMGRIAADIVQAVELPGHL